MRMGELMTATVPGDPEIIRSAAAQVDAMVQESDQVLNALSLELAVEQAGDGGALTPRLQQGVAIRDRLRADRGRAVERRDALLEYADTLHAQQVELAAIAEELSEQLDGVALLPMVVDDTTGTPWWTWTRLAQTLALRLGHDVPDAPRVVAAASPALIDAIYLTLSEWNRQGTRHDVSQLPFSTEAMAAVPLQAYLDAGTTIAAEESAVAGEIPPLGELEQILREADSALVLITAVADTLCLYQGWTTASAGALASGDGAEVQLAELTPELLREQLRQAADFSATEVIGDSLALPKLWVERLVSPDSIVRTRAARHLSELVDDPAVAQALATDTWRSIALSSAHSDGTNADGAAGLWLLAAGCIWQVTPDDETAQLHPVTAAQADEQFAALLVATL